VGAHFDKVDDGHGVVDNWSGAALLPSIYQALHVAKRRHTIIFIGFSAEEQGLIGSKNYVEHLTKQEKSNIHGMIAIDSLGLGSTEVWARHSDRKLIGLLIAVSKSLHFPVSGMDVDYVGDTDSSPFRDQGIPTITFHSITSENWAILHSNKDAYVAIDQSAYVESCHLITDYIAYLDEVLDPTPPPASTNTN
jgi:Zn-dependent M28 family amino/carboxypeptidase